MKFKIYNYLLFLFIIFISCSYNFGEKDGDDLQYGWYKDYVDQTDKTERYEFYDDGKGVFRDLDSWRGKDYHYDYKFFTYKVKQTSPKKTIELKLYDSPNDYINNKYKKEKYEYYFNSNKTNLYLTNSGYTFSYFNKCKRTLKDKINKIYEEYINKKIID